MSQTVWPLNENGEIVVTAGTGSSNVTGYLSQDVLPSAGDGIPFANVLTSDKFASQWNGFGGNANGVTTVFIGDSITANGWLSNLARDTSSPTGIFYYDDGSASGVRFARTEDYGFSAWCHFFSNGGVGEFVNSGIGGNTTTQILARVDSDVLAYNPLLIVDECGTNDVIAGASSADIIARKTALIEKYRSIGAKIVLVDIAPRSGFDTAMKAVAVAVNKWMYSLPRKNRDITVFSMSSILADHTSSSGAVSTTKTFDSTHPNNVGAVMIGKQLAAHIDKFVFAQFNETIWTADAFGTDSANATIRNSNPAMYYSTGGTANTGVSGSVANGFTCSRLAGTPTVVASVAERPDGRGYTQRLVITFGAAGDAVEFGIPTGSSRYLADGRKISTSCNIDLVTGSNDVVNRLILYTSAVVSGVTYTATAMNQQDSTGRGNLPTSLGIKGNLLTPKIQVPAGSASGFSTQLRIYASAAGTVTIDLSEYKLMQHL